MGRVLTGMIAAAYVTDNPAGVARDGATGRITGARLYLHSYVDLDGTARHVVTGASPVGARRREALATAARLRCTRRCWRSDSRRRRSG
jgi:hypothetical protein